MDRLAVLARHLQGAGDQQLCQERGVTASATSASIQAVEQHAAAVGASEAMKDLARKFPQATPAQKFPQAVSDYLKLETLLSPEERKLQLKVREFMEKEVAPIIAHYWEKAEFPYDLLPKLGKLGVAGTTIKGYGCPGLSTLGGAMVFMEMARVDASIATFMLVHTALAMSTIARLGSEAQKQKYLPKLASLEWVSCWGLTEPDFGSDASSLHTTAQKVDGGWLLNGQKRWIGNAPFADVVVIWAKNTSTNEINCYIVRKGAPGFRADKMENKIGLRCVQNGDISMRNVFVPDDDRLPGCNSFRDTNKVLAESRLMVAWEPVGIAMGVYDMCSRYLSERRQFGAPLTALQLNQEKLARILGNVQAMFLMSWRSSQLFEEGTMTHGQASLTKAFNTLRARECTALGRELLGGNGIVVDFHVAKAFCDLEPIYTYEGTYDINALVVGREITGIAAIKSAAAVLSKKAR